jgi:hypothetical protein
MKCSVLVSLIRSTGLHSSLRRLELSLSLKLCLSLKMSEVMTISLSLELLL